MIVYIGGAEFVAQLQRERDEKIAVNIGLQRQVRVLSEVLDTVFGSGATKKALDPAGIPTETYKKEQEQSSSDKCVICGTYSEGGTYGEQFPLCFECYSTRAEDVHEFIRNNTKRKLP